jgi:PAS domain S-box-containing protein
VTPGVRRSYNPRAAGLFCLALGGVVLGGWWLDIDALKRILPGLASMKFNTAAGFVLGGGALWAVGSARPKLLRAGRLASFALLALGGASAFEWLGGVALGIDQFFMPDLDTLARLHPGRMAFATALGFVLLGGSLLARLASPPRPWQERVARFCAWALAGVGALGIAGYASDVDIFYTVPGFGSVALHTAVGFVAAALGVLGSFPRQALPNTPADEGVVAFGLLAHNVRQTLAHGLQLAFESRAAQISTNLGLRTERAAILASSPTLLKQLRVLAADPANSAAIETVQDVLASFDTHGFEHIELRDPQGRVIAQTGAAPAGEVELAVALPGTPERQLAWHDNAFHLHVRQPLVDAQGALGTVVSEQYLPALTKLMRATPPPWASTDFRLCAVVASQLLCFPSLRRAQPTRAPLGEAAGDPLPALAPGFHVRNVGDGQRSLGYVGRVGDTGLIAVLEVDAADIYAPIARQFLWTLLLVATLASASIWLLRRRMDPLVARLVAAEAEARDHLAAFTTSSALLHSVFDDSPDAILVVDGDGKIIEASPRTTSLFGHARSQLLGQPVEILLPARYRAAHPGHRAGFALHPGARAMGSGLALFGQRADGSEFPLDVVLSPIHSGSGAQTIAIIRDISERRASEKQIADALAEKTVLLQEIHHRVKNNLQVIASLLNLQAGNSEDAATRAALNDSQGRVKSMALLHQLLYEKRDFAQVDLGEYLAQIARHVLASANAAHIVSTIDVAPVQLDLQRAVPCGLLVNELLSNVCKHAFPDGRAGSLRIELHQPDADGSVLLVVADDGVGLPADVEPGKTRSLGLQLVALLADQLDAQIKLVRGKGTRYEIRFRV